MPLDVSDSADLTPEQLLSDPLYVKQWASHFHSAAQSLGEQTFNLEGQEFQAAWDFIRSEDARRQAKYPGYNRVATRRGLLGGGTDVWTHVDFPGGDAILGSHPNSVEFKLRAQFPAAYTDLAPFVPPSPQEGV